MKNEYSRLHLCERINSHNFWNFCFRRIYEELSQSRLEVEPISRQNYNYKTPSVTERAIIGNFVEAATSSGKAFGVPAPRDQAD